MEHEQPRQLDSLTEMFVLWCPVCSACSAAGRTIGIRTWTTNVGELSGAGIEPRFVVGRCRQSRVRYFTWWWSLVGRQVRVRQVEGAQVSRLQQVEQVAQAATSCWSPGAQQQRQAVMLLIAPTWQASGCRATTISAQLNTSPWFDYLSRDLLEEEPLFDCFLPLTTLLTWFQSIALLERTFLQLGWSGNQDSLNASQHFSLCFFKEGFSCCLYLNPKRTFYSFCFCL